MRQYSLTGMLVSGLLVALVAAPRPVSAVDYSKIDWKKRFEELDKNQDGKVTTAEWSRNELFRLIDDDGNGEITRDEALAFFEKTGTRDKKPAEPTGPNSGPTPTKDKTGQPAKTGQKPVTLDAPSGKGPRVLPASGRSVGRLVPDVAFQDITGKSQRLSDFRDQAVTVIAMTSTTCPLSQKLLPSLATLEKQYASSRVRFLFVNSIPTEKPDELQELASRMQLAGPYVHDAKEDFARAVGATSTTDVIVLDASRTVLYQGCVDDQYGLGYSLEQPRVRYLAQALDSILAGLTPLVVATTAPGCVMDTEPTEGVAGTVTYHERVARIVRQACAECHHDGGVGPFALTSLDDLKAHKGMIRQVVEQGSMPPWFAAPKAEGSPSPFRNDRTLPTEDKRDLLAWLASDMPEGNPENSPLPYVAPGQWSLGQPDLVLRLPRPIAIKATGTMPYQNVAVETHLTEDEWVNGLEVRPSNRAVVHHVLVFVIPPGSKESGTRDQDDDESRGFFAAYVPGAVAARYPEGYAKLLPKGSKLRFQLHYTPNGTATEDQTEIALTFAKQPPRHEIRVTGIVDAKLNIPPGASHHEEGATLRVPADARILALMPHMHVRGKAFRYELIDPSGQSEMLLDIPRYDFNWQLGYAFAQPKEVAAGSTLKVTGWFDNSEGNPANPDPTKTVKWGPQTYDEMLIGYIEYYIPSAEPGGAGASFGRDSLPGIAGQIEKIYRELDQNKDQRITREEFQRIEKFAPQLTGNTPLVDALFKRLDKDGDGAISVEDLQRLRNR